MRMKKFEFENKRTNHDLELEIGGTVFRFNPLTAKVMKACEKFAVTNEVLQNNLKSIKSGDDELYKKLNLDTCKICAEFIESTLGGNAYDQIFENRTLDFEEHMNVTAFILEAISEYSIKIVNEHTAN